MEQSLTAPSLPTGMANQHIIPEVKIQTVNQRFVAKNTVIISGPKDLVRFFRQVVARAA
jgi:hypothetical protein